MAGVFVKFEDSANFFAFSTDAVCRVVYLSRGDTGTIYFLDGSRYPTTRENCQLVERAIERATAYSGSTVRPMLAASEVKP